MCARKKCGAPAQGYFHTDDFRREYCARCAKLINQTCGQTLVIKGGE